MATVPSETSWARFEVSWKPSEVTALPCGYCSVTAMTVAIAPRNRKDARMTRDGVQVIFRGSEIHGPVSWE